MRKDNVKYRELLAVLEKNPNIHHKALAREVGCSLSYAFKALAEIRAAKEAPAPEPAPEPTPEELDTVLEAAATMAPVEGIDKVLDERGSRYGSFLKHAIITQRLKAVMTDTPNWIALNDDMVESLEMIAHKIGRILNGDPSYADSWVDIAGYAKLVADRLEGKVR